MNKTPKWIQKLVAMRACTEAMKWAVKQPNLHTAWVKCKRPDWLWWLLENVKDALPSTSDERIRMWSEMDWLRGQHRTRFRYYCQTCRVKHALSPGDGYAEARVLNKARCNFIRYYFPTPGPQKRKRP